MNKILLSLLLLSLHGLAQPIPKTMKHLPDSGQNTSYTSVFGEDNDYSFFTPYYLNNNDGTVTDTVTGLMWQRTDGGEMTFENAKIYCDTLTLGGYTNWRLPSVREGFSILDLGALNPAMNTTYFPNTTAEYWWSSEKAKNDTNKIWVTNSGGGQGAHPRNETISAGGNKKFHARAVRDIITPAIIPAHFTVNGDSTVTDNLTNLMWIQYPTTDSLSWSDALNLAEQTAIAGHTDWRLPNIKELQSLNNTQLYQPSIDNTIFPSIQNAKYWSSTSQYPNGTNAWYIDIQNYGLTTYLVKSRKLLVMTVRNASLPNAIQQVTDYKLQCSVFPNPTTNMLHVSWQNEEQKLVQLMVIDMHGRCFFSISTMQQSLIINTDYYPKGMYFVKITKAENEGCASFIKE